MLRCVALRCVVWCGLVLCVLVYLCWSKCCSAQGNALQEKKAHFKNHVAADIEKYVWRAVEPRICIMWTSSSLHVAIMVSQVCSGFVTARVLFFSVSTLRRKRSSCPSMAGPWVSFSLDPAYAARITWNIGDIVECHHVDHEGNLQGHSVSLVDSAAPNGGFNVKNAGGFSFARC